MMGGFEPSKGMFVTYLGAGVDAGDERFEDDHLIIALCEDEQEEGTHQAWLRQRAQEQVQVRRGRHHLLPGVLHQHTSHSYTHDMIRTVLRMT